MLVASPTEASLRLQVTDLLLGRRRDGTKGPVDPESRAMSCDRSKRRWKPTGATFTLPRPANGMVAVR